RVTVVDHAPLLNLAVPICVPLSYSVRVEPAAASVVVTVPEIVCAAWLVVTPAVVIATVGAWVSSVNAAAPLVPVLPAASVSLAVMLFEPSLRVTVVDHAPLLKLAVPICVPLSYSVTVEPAAASVVVTVPEIVCAAWLVVTPAVVIATVGAWVSSVNAAAPLVPVLPAASVSLAVMLFEPSLRVTVVDHAPLLKLAVPICVPLSYSVTVEPAAASVVVTVPEIVCAAWLVVMPAVVIATVGAWVSSVNAAAPLVPVLPAASVSLAVMLFEPSLRVTVVDHAPLLKLAVPICVPLSYSVTVEPAAASVVVTVPEIVCAAWLVVTPAVVIATVGAWVSSVNAAAPLVPVLPAASVSLAVMLFEPSLRVTVVDHAPLLKLAVPICVPLSYSVTVEPAAASVVVTVPEIVCAAWLVVTPAVVIATVGAWVSSVSVTSAILIIVPGGFTEFAIGPVGASYELEKVTSFALNPKFAVMVKLSVS